MFMLTALEQRVLDNIDVDGLISTLQVLIAQPSLGGSQAEYTIQQIAAAELTAQGLSVDITELDLPTLYTHPDFPGYEVERVAALHVQAALDGVDGGRNLLLNGHLDVVPVGDVSSWRHWPWDGIV